jgi:hypothetical protein
VLADVAAAAIKGQFRDAAPGAADPTPTAYVSSHCQVWDHDSTHTDPLDVPCAQPHLFEAVTDISVEDTYPHGAAFPSESRWSPLIQSTCLAADDAYIDHPIDPEGRLRVAAIHPNAAAWELGGRTPHCGIDVDTPGVAHVLCRSDLSTGHARDIDQALVFPAGGCLSEASQTVHVDDGAAPHDYAVVGTATMPDIADGSPPSEADVDQTAGIECQAVLATPLGASFPLSDTVQLTWFRLQDDSWQVGTREFSCVIHYTISEGSPRTVTGDVHTAP